MAANTMLNTFLNLSELLKVRLMIGRFGEMDMAKWWNTQGMLGLPASFGFMEIYRGDDVLRMHCWLDANFYNKVYLGLIAGKIHYISVFGTKLKWRKGDIMGIDFATEYDNDE